MSPTILIIPGLRDHVPDHWQTHLASRLAPAHTVRTIAPLEHDKMSCAARVQAIESNLQAIEGPVIAVAHSAGSIMLVHWARQYRRANLSAILVTPADLEHPLPPGYPTMQVLQANGWLPLPMERLSFPSIVAASTNDPLARFERVKVMADQWGADFVNVGAVGHLNPASGYGPWPQANALIQHFA